MVITVIWSIDVTLFFQYNVICDCDIIMLNDINSYRILLNFVRKARGLKDVYRNFPHVSSQSVRLIKKKSSFWICGLYDLRNRKDTCFFSLR